MSDEKDYLDYIDDLTPEEREWVVKFYNEYHRGDFYSSDNHIMNDPEHQKEARRNNNMRNLDALQAGQLEPIDGDRQAFMEEASDFWEWDNIYSTLGYTAAYEEILSQTERDINNKHIDTRTVLVRMYTKLKKLDRFENRRRKHDKKKK